MTLVIALSLYHAVNASATEQFTGCLNLVFFLFVVPTILMI